MNHADSVPPRENPERSHEQSDVNVRAIVLFGVVLIIAALIIHVGLYWLLQWYEITETRRAPRKPPMQAERQVPPEPRLQTSPSAELAVFREAEERQLQTYQWVDKEKQIVSVPIERAMELVAQKGLPARKTATDRRQNIDAKEQQAGGGKQ